MMYADCMLPQVTLKIHNKHTDGKCKLCFLNFQQEAGWEYLNFGLKASLGYNSDYEL